MNCILCGKTGVIKYKESIDTMLQSPGSWTLKVCIEDNIIWVDERASDEEFALFYKNYPSHEKSLKKKIGLLSKINDYITGFEIVDKFFSEGHFKKVLDFGCGGGAFMSELRERSFDVYGVEFEDSLVSKLESEFGQNHIKVTSKISDFPKNFFDVIFLNHVIEHLPNPAESLSSLFLLLKEGGNIIIATPNIDSLGHLIFQSRWRGLEVPRHRFIFSSKSLRVILEKSGLVVVKMYYSARLSRGIFVSSLFPSWEAQKNKPSIRYVIHFFGLIFAVLGVLLGYIGLGKYNEEMIFLIRKPEKIK